MRKMLFRPVGGDPGAGTTNDSTTDNAASKGAAGTSGGDEGWKPPATKEEYDSAITAAVDAAKPKAPDKYELALPKDSKLNPKLTERTAAIARELGLSNEAAAKVFGHLSQEAQTHAEASVQAAIASYAAPTKENPEGGAEWRKQEQQWRDAALKDSELGAGKPEQLEQSAKLAERVLAKFGDDDVLQFFHNSGLGSNPAALKLLVRIGRAMKESELVRDTKRDSAGSKDAVSVMYGDGRGADPRGSIGNQITVTK